MKERIAVIDLGTNTFHLLIAEQNPSGMKILHREKVPVKLGMAGINQGMITEEAIQRGLTCLRHFSSLLQSWEVGHSSGFGTSALRSAGNGKAVARRFQEETGIRIELISGDQEATFIYHGVCTAVPMGDEKSLIVDIGGGSVEFIIGDGRFIYWKQSIEMGAQRLLELYHRHDPILPEEVLALREHFKRSLLSVAEAIHEWKPVSLVGSSGTFDTLSEIFCLRMGVKLEFDQPETPLTVEGFYPINQEFVTKDRAERMQIPGMIEMRVDMIVVASCLVHYLIETFSFRKIRVSSYSLKEGILACWPKSEPGC